MNAPADSADKSRFRPSWWKHYFAGELEYFWPASLAKLEDSPHGYVEIDRDDVFALAQTDGAHRELHTAVAAYAWGVGKWAFLIGRQVRPFTKHSDVVEERLRNAAGALSREGAVEAYSTMVPGGKNYVPFMGPAYFTKFLFFMGYRNECPGPKPLILDRRVATALRAGAVMDLADSGWSASTYEQYLAYCHNEQPEDPKSVEKDLFERGRGS